MDDVAGGAVLEGGCRWTSLVLRVLRIQLQTLCFDMDNYGVRRLEGKRGAMGADMPKGVKTKSYGRQVHFTFFFWLSQNAEGTNDMVVPYYPVSPVCLSSLFVQHKSGKYA